MTTPQITMSEIDAWLEAETPEIYKSGASKDYKNVFQIGMTRAILWTIANGSDHDVRELAARIKRAQPKQETTV